MSGLSNLKGHDPFCKTRTSNEIFFWSADVAILWTYFLFKSSDVLISYGRDKKSQKIIDFRRKTIHLKYINISKQFARWNILDTSVAVCLCTSIHKDFSFSKSLMLRHHLMLTILQSVKRKRKYCRNCLMTINMHWIHWHASMRGCLIWISYQSFGQSNFVVFFKHIFFINVSEHNHTLFERIFQLIFFQILLRFLQQ